MPDITVTPQTTAVTVTPATQSLTVTEGANFAVSFPLSASSTFIGADQAATANTWYTLGGLTLAPGTYLLLGTVTAITTANAGNIDARLYNGSLLTDIAASSASTPRASSYGSVTVHCTLTIASTTIVQLGGYLTQTGTILYRSSQSIANATGLVALRIA